MSLLTDILRGHVVARGGALATCALDVADEGAHTLEETAALLGGVSVSRVHQIETAAEAKLAARVVAAERPPPARSSGVYRVAERRRIA